MLTLQHADANRNHMQAKNMGGNKTILIAEPGGSTPKELEYFIKSRFFDLVKARNLKEVLLTLQENRVDVLVMDAVLLKDDCGFIAVIKGMEKDLPIIVCAEENTPEMESEIRKYEIFYYHIKSFGVEDLVMAISNAVNGLSH